MKYRTFGSLGWKVSEIGLGTYAIGGYWGSSDDSESRKVIERAYSSGVNFYDTADLYGRGKAEKFIAEILVKNGLREEIFIATKAGYDFYSDPPKLIKNFDPLYLDMALNKSLERLGTDYVDLFQLHSASVEDMAEGSVIKFLERTKEDGRVKAAGVSVYDLSGVQEVVRHDVFDSVQFIVNMLSEKEEIEEMIRLSASRNLGIIAREPLEQSLLSGNYSYDSSFPKDDHRSVKWNQEYLEKQLPRVDYLRKLANEERTLAQTAIKFVLSYPEISTAIVGARRLNHLQENIEASEMVELTNEELAIIYGA